VSGGAGGVDGQTDLLGFRIFGIRKVFVSFAFWVRIQKVFVSFGKVFIFLDPKCFRIFWVRIQKCFRIFGSKGFSLASFRIFWIQSKSTATSTCSCVCRSPLISISHLHAHGRRPPTTAASIHLPIYRCYLRTLHLPSSCPASVPPGPSAVSSVNLPKRPSDRLPIGQPLPPTMQHHITLGTVLNEIPSSRVQLSQKMPLKSS
jgi:hypothetical protein